MIRIIRKIVDSVKYVYRTVNDDTPERIIRELESERQHIKEYLRNHDPYITEYCTVQHDRCKSCGLLIWEKDAHHRYIKANDKHLSIFYELSVEDKETILGHTDAELIKAWRERTGLENTFGEMCVSTDEYIKQTGRPARFFEFGYRKGEIFLLDVFKTPVVVDGKFQGTRGNALDISSRESDAVDLLAAYMKVGIAKRLDHGKGKDVAVYLIRDRRKKFNREFPV